MGLRGFFKNLFARRVKVDEIVNEDIIIVVIGPTGAGKSSFINIATGGSEALINSGLASCTEEITNVKCTYPGDVRGRSVVFVDTPAFNHDTKPVDEIGRDIMKWMTKTYDRKNKVAGILYLHRITDVRLTESPLAHLLMFQQSWGGNVLPQRVVLATTMWSQVNPATGCHREEEIREFWGTMVALGSGITRFEDTTESAWRVVNLLLGADEDL